jgi:hypothetical protein
MRVDVSRNQVMTCAVTATTRRKPYVGARSDSGTQMFAAQMRVDVSCNSVVVTAAAKLKPYVGMRRDNSTDMFAAPILVGAVTRRGRIVVVAGRGWIMVFARRRIGIVAGWRRVVLVDRKETHGFAPLAFVSANKGYNHRKSSQNFRSPSN